MLIKIKTSKESEDIISRIRFSTKLDLNVIARLGISLSLYSHKPVKSDQGFSDRTGKEFNIYSLLGEYETLYKTVFALQERKKLSEDDFERLLKFHLENGLKTLNKLYLDSNEDSVEFLSKLGSLVSPTGGIMTPKNIEPLNIEIGEEELTRKPVFFEFNNTREYSNPHLAITGTTGSGKTQVLLKILYDIRHQSRYNTNFIFFDYKGEFLNKFGKFTDPIKEKFISDVKATTFQLPEDQLPINPFVLPRYENNDIKISAEEKAESFSSIGNIGTVQKEDLITVIKNAYEARKDKEKPYPDFSEIYMLLKKQYEITNKKNDTLTGVLRKLSEFHLFWEHDSEENIFDSLVDKTLVIDLSKLPALKELVMYLIIERLYKEMTVLPDSKVVDGYRHIRTILVVDEAHNYLPQKNVFLQKIIREGRSRGIAVFFASQSPSDYEQRFFDFKELLEFCLIFQSKSISTNAIQDLLGCSSSSAKELRIKIPSLRPFDCVTSSKNFSKPYISLRASPLFELFKSLG